MPLSAVFKVYKGRHSHLSDTPGHEQRSGRLPRGDGWRRESPFSPPRNPMILIERRRVVGSVGCFGEIFRGVKSWDSEKLGG